MKYFKVLPAVFWLIACWPSSTRSQTPSITLLQHAGKDAGTTTSTTIAFPSTNSAGNWIGVFIRAGRSGETFTVSDANGNAYRKAVQYNVTVDTPNGNTMGIFYAENIAGGGNTITVSSSLSATLRIAIVEYSGIATANSLDVIAAAQGNGVSPDSGNAVTSAPDLLLGAISTANSASITAGSGFSIMESVPAKPGTKLFAEQQIQTVAGTSSTHASLASSDNWGAILAGFKASGAGGSATPNIAALNPASGPVGTLVTITGTNFGASPGAVAFSGTAATPRSWSATSVSVPVPNGATSGNVVLTAAGRPSNATPFTVTVPDTTPPQVSITSPVNNATVAGTVTVSATASDNVAVASVQFKVDNANSGAALTSAPYTLALNTTTLPDGNHVLTALATDTSGNATTSAAVAVNVSNALPAPIITGVNPSSGAVGTTVSITGTGFGVSQGTSAVTFNGTAATPTSWNVTNIIAAVPAGATAGNVVLTVGGVPSNGVNFTVHTPPSITSLSPASGAVGTPVTITGTNFGATQGTGTVTFNGTAATPTSWNATTIVAPVPSGATTGNIVVTTAIVGGGSGGTTSNGLNFTVTSTAPSISSLSPTSGVVGTPVTITGMNFGSSQGTSTVTFNGTAATPSSWSASTIVVPVPAGATTGNVLLTVGGAASNLVNFIVTPPFAGITLVQRGTQNAGVTTSSSVTFATPNTAGNFIAVCVRAGFSGQVFRISDSGGNIYRQGVQLNVTVDTPNGDTLAIFYAENIKGGPNTITVSDTISGTLRFSVLEYSGVAIASSLDAIATGQGASTAPNSGNAVTTANGELLLSAVATANPGNFTAGSGFVMEGSVPAQPSAKLIAEDRIQPAAGTVSAGALLAAPDNWGVTLATFRAGGNAPAGGPPSVVSLNPTSGSIGTPVTISGANFGAAQGASSVKFNGTVATPSSWSGTTITAAVPAGATTGNVVVTVAGVPSNSTAFTVQTDTTAPVVNLTAPANNATVAANITLSATATDSDSAVSFVQFQVDGVNTGAPLTSAPYSISLDTTTLSNGVHLLTAIARDPSANQGNSAAITITVSNVPGSGATGPLRPLPSNPNYFTDGTGKAILLTGSQTWDSFQDLDQSSSPAALDFNAYVNFLKSHGHNVTILWRKDLPTYCNWGAGGTWHIKQFPWMRTGGSGGTQVASDGLPAFDLTQFDQTYFDRLRSRVIQLQQNGIYAVVQLFDGLGLTSNRCANDGYPFTGGNNLNGVDDGGGEGSMTMSGPNAISSFQDAFVQKVIDTLNDQPNVLWEISEEAPNNSIWWENHMIALIHSYEAGKPFKHPVGYPSLNVSGAVNANLYNSDADWVAPFARISPTSSCGSGTPACKVNINDSDHSYFGMWNDTAQNNRGYVWRNFASGNSVMFMDPYVIFWTSGNRNLCSSPSNGVCSGPDSRWNNMRDNLGYTLRYANKMDLAKMTPQPGLASTGYCLAQNAGTGSEFLVYQPAGGAFTVNLSATTRVLNIEWFDPSSGNTISGSAITGGSAAQSFTPPFGGDAVLYLVDAAGHN